VEPNKFMIIDLISGTLALSVTRWLNWLFRYIY